MPSSEGDQVTEESQAAMNVLIKNPKNAPVSLFQRRLEKARGC
jgi:hypothetical protein